MGLSQGDRGAPTREQASEPEPPGRGKGRVNLPCGLVLQHRRTGERGTAGHLHALRPKASADSSAWPGALFARFFHCELTTDLSFRAGGERIHGFAPFGAWFFIPCPRGGTTRRSRPQSRPHNAIGGAKGQLTPDPFYDAVSTFWCRAINSAHSRKNFHTARRAAAQQRPKQGPRRPLPLVDHKNIAEWLPPAIRGCRYGLCPSDPREDTLIHLRARTCHQVFAHHVAYTYTIEIQHATPVTTSNREATCRTET